MALGVIVPTKLCAPNATEAYARYASARGLAIDPDVQPRYQYAGAYDQADAAELLVTAIDMFETHNVSTCFSFHRLNKWAGDACDAWRAALARLERTDVSVGRVDGRMSSRERAEVLEPLRTLDPSRLRIVANARLLIEGFDMPTVDLVMLAEAMRSPVQIQQAAARAQRPLPGKSCGYVLVPVRGSFEDGVPDGVAMSVDVLLAFANEDPALASDLQALVEASDGRDVPYDEWPGRLRDRVALLGSGEGLRREIALIERSVNAVVVELSQLGRSAVAEKVAWLCAMHADAKPLQKKVDVPPSLLPAGAPPTSFNGGQFLARIRNNWLEGEPGTRLSPELMAQVEALPWFSAWLEGLRKGRAARNV